MMACYRSVYVSNVINTGVTCTHTVKMKNTHTLPNDNLSIQEIFSPCACLTAFLSAFVIHSAQGICVHFTPIRKISLSTINPHSCFLFPRGMMPFLIHTFSTAEPRKYGSLKYPLFYLNSSLTNFCLNHCDQNELMLKNNTFNIYMKPGQKC